MGSVCEALRLETHRLVDAYRTKRLTVLEVVCDEFREGRAHISELD